MPSNAKGILYLLLKIPAELKNQFRAVCAARGRTMKSEIARLMEREVKTFEKSKK